MSAKSKGITRPPVSAQNAALIELMLQKDARIVKSGLQKACEFLEAGHAFLDNQFLVFALYKHLGSPSIQVRRWAYKLAGRLQDEQFKDMLKERFKIEIDEENRTWAGAALIGLMTRKEALAFIEELDQEFYEQPIELASKLFRRGEPLELPNASTLDKFERLPLSRKWLCILCGYAFGNPRSIAKKFDDLDVVANLVTDHVPEVVEYAVWTLFRHPRGTFRLLPKKPDELVEYANVYRWLMRLVTKNETAARSNRDLIAETMESKRVEVREGLALGISKLTLPFFNHEVLDWFSREQDQSVRLALVDHVAKRSAENNFARDTLRSVYAGIEGHSLLALKIQATVDAELLADIIEQRLPLAPQATSGSMQILPGDRSDDRQLLLFDEAATSDARAIFNDNRNIQLVQINIRQENNSMNRTFHGGSNNNNSGINLGEMFASSIGAVSKSSDSTIKQLAPLIAAFLEKLQAADVDPEDKRAVIDLVAEAEKAEDSEVRNSKLRQLKGFVQGITTTAGLGASLIENGQKLVAALGGVLG